MRVITVSFLMVCPVLVTIVTESRRETGVVDSTENAESFWETPFYQLPGTGDACIAHTSGVGWRGLFTGKKTQLPPDEGDKYDTIFHRVTTI